MIQSKQLILYKTASPDFYETQRLISHFAGLRRTRRPLYLTEKDFERILHWKLRRQYYRQKDFRAINTPSIIHLITKAALSLQHNDREYETELQLKILSSIRGVGIPVASAILTLVFPEKYAVIDFRGWRQVFGEGKTTFTISEYKKYLHEIHRMAIELGWTPQEVDLAIWAYDQQHPV